MTVVELIVELQKHRDDAIVLFEVVEEHGRGNTLARRLQIASVFERFGAVTLSEFHDRSNASD